VAFVLVLKTAAAPATKEPTLPSDASMPRSLASSRSPLRLAKIIGCRRYLQHHCRLVNVVVVADNL